jgi:hypothetical protein
VSPTTSFASLPAERGALNRGRADLLCSQSTRRVGNCLFLDICLASPLRPEGAAPKGLESIAQGLPWEAYFFASCPHKALPRSALLEKHPVRRVGGAEGAPEIAALGKAIFCRPFRAVRLEI